MTDRSWVQIQLGTGLFYLLHPFSSASLIQVPHGGAALLIFLYKYAQLCSLRAIKHGLSKKKSCLAKAQARWLIGKQIRSPKNVGPCLSSTRHWKFIFSAQRIFFAAVKMLITCHLLQKGSARKCKNASLLSVLVGPTKFRALTFALKRKMFMSNHFCIPRFARVSGHDMFFNAWVHFSVNLNNIGS